MSFWFYTFTTLSLISVALWRRATNAHDRLPIVVYLVSYLVTTVIGAVAISFMGGGLVWNIQNPTMDITFVRMVDNFRYWFVLLAPFLVVPATTLLLDRVRFRMPLAMPHLRLPDPDVFSFLGVFALFAFYCVVQLYRAGLLGGVAEMFSLAGDYESLILVRTAMFGTLGTAYYGVVYVALPTLSYVALYQAVCRRGVAWPVVFGTCTIAVCFFLLSTYLKGPLLLYLIGVAIGLAILKVFRAWHIVTAGLAAVLVFTALQALFLPGWTVLQSFVFLFFRMADGYPFYVNLFPEAINFLGTDYGTALLGFGSSPRDNLLVFDYMYPDIQWVQGATAAAAHVRAYAMGGEPAAVAQLVIIGIAFSLLNRMRRDLDSPIRFAFYLQGVICAYHLTQTSMRGITVESYSIAFAAIALLLTAAAAFFVQAGSAHVSLTNGTALRPK